jgi:release factor glutamine methyltransferase
VANPPYVPAAGGGERIAWCDGGPDGRSVIDPICRGASALLRDGGKLWMVHSELADVGRSLELLSIHGLEPEVVATTTHELGPITLARFDELVLAGRIAADAESEEISVIVAKKPAR